MNTKLHAVTPFCGLPANHCRAVDADDRPIRFFMPAGPPLGDVCIACRATNRGCDADCFRDADGRRRRLRRGHLLEREVQTGIGALPVKGPWVRDPEGAPLRLTSTRDFSKALAAVPGPHAPGL